MDQPISCQEINHIYKHPLSILIHQKFQDKDGCSRNGSREFLFEVGLVTKEEDSDPLFISRWSVSLDYRGVCYFIFSRYDSGPEKVNDFMKMALNWKTCYIRNSPIQLSLSESERETINLIEKISNLGNLYFKRLGYVTFLDHVISLEILGSMTIVTFDDHFISTLSQLPYLNNLSVAIKRISPNLSQFSLLSNLISLNLDFQETPMDDKRCLDFFSDFSAFKVLRQLNITGCHNTVHTGPLFHIDQLSFVLNLSVEHISFLKRLSKLTLFYGSYFEGSFFTQNYQIKVDICYFCSFNKTICSHLGFSQ